MSTAATRPTPVAAWALAGLAVFLLYILSAPAVRYVFSSPFGSVRPPTFDPRQADGREALAKLYAEPYLWLGMHTPLRPILRRYEQWWFNRLVWGSYYR